VKLTTDIHEVPRLITCGVVSPVPQYAFIVWYLVKQAGEVASLDFLDYEYV
jgi:hypothetical protein